MSAYPEPYVQKLTARQAAAVILLLSLASWGVVWIAIWLLR